MEHDIADRRMLLLPELSVLVVVSSVRERGGHLGAAAPHAQLLGEGGPAGAGLLVGVRAVHYDALALLWGKGFGVNGLSLDGDTKI